MTAETTTGRLLVSTPLIEEGVFYRSVVLILQHNDEGAQGLVLNKPLDADIDAVLPGWGGQVGDPATLFHGGPVHLDSVLALVDLSDSVVPLGAQRLFDNVGVVDLDSAPDRIGEAVTTVRIWAGYAGWSPGQLESEIRSESWWLVDALPSDPFTETPQSLWAEVLRRQTSQLALVSFLPEDPSIN